MEEGSVNEFFEDFREKLDNLLKQIINEKNSPPKEAENDSIPSQSHPNGDSKEIPVNSIYFLNSEEDPTGFKAILTNFMEFSDLCAENNFHLCVEHEGVGGPTVIRLDQTAKSSNRRQFFIELENLIRKKASDNDGLDCNLADLDAKWEKKFEIFKKSLEEERRKEMDDMKEELKKSDEKWENKFSEEVETLKTSLDTHKKLLEDIKIQMKLEHLKREKNKVNQLKRLMSTTDFTAMKANSDLLEAICLKLSNEVDDSSYDPPLNSVPSMDEKKKFLVEYLDYLQNPSRASPMVSKITSSFYYHSSLFYATATESDLEIGMEEIKKKCNFDNIVGTIHMDESDFKPSDGAKNIKYVAIINQKIVAWTREDSILKGLRGLYDKLRHLKLKKDMRFATTLSVSEKLSGLFVQYSNEEMFAENKKVMEWMELWSSSCRADLCHGSAIPAIYNMSADFLRESRD